MEIINGLQFHTCVDCSKKTRGDKTYYVEGGYRPRCFDCWLMT